MRQKSYRKALRTLEVDAKLIFMTEAKANLRLNKVGGNLYIITDGYLIPHPEDETSKAFYKDYVVVGSSWAGLQNKDTGFFTDIWVSPECTPTELLYGLVYHTNRWEVKTERAKLISEMYGFIDEEFIAWDVHYKMLRTAIEKIFGSG